MVASRVEWEAEPALLKSVKIVSEGGWELRASRRVSVGEAALHLEWAGFSLSGFVASPAHVREFAELLIKLVDQGAR